jgi:hypothetical protein
MKRAIIYILFSCLLFSCEKVNLNLTETSKLKTLYIFASSTETKPYSFTSYSYDQNWNLSKELISDYPKPAWSSYTYKYSDKGELIIKDHWMKVGNNFPDQKESDFSLVEEYKYLYQDNNKIEKIYRNNILTDSAIYTYSNNHLISEYHYDLINSLNWSLLNEYDSNDRLIKITTHPEGFYTVYLYDSSNIQKTSEYDQNGKLLVENTYVYTYSRSNEIIEIFYKGPYGEFLSDKVTYSSGNVIESIKYDPSFQGAESHCYKYEYY